MERGTVIDQLVYCINSYREAAMSNDPKFDHIDMSEKQKVTDWLQLYLFFMLTSSLSFVNHVVLSVLVGLERMC